MRQMCHDTWSWNEMQDVSQYKGKQQNSGVAEKTLKTDILLTSYENWTHKKFRENEIQFYTKFEHFTVIKGTRPTKYQT